MTKEPNYPRLAEAFYEKGRQHARAGMAPYAREQFVSEGFNPDGWRFYVNGYNETWSAMSHEERKQAALRSSRTG